MKVSKDLECLNSGSETNQKAKWNKVLLISSEGKPVEIPVDVCEECHVLSKMLESTDFVEGKQKRIALPIVKYATLKKVVEYLEMKRRWRNGESRGSFIIPDNLALDLLVAANFFGLD